ncbi:hypothetical protein HMN09_01168500 [Mycena chlorophos]|uniref:DUF659 domain-containing protein n=1 Tax=Mycena chlorophos TaxID=658473 RepID=A0A8H6VXF7_MYCCL|nr:hypothetical protein HMN09_01168500 [Mycena chlorophos]
MSASSATAADPKTHKQSPIWRIFDTDNIAYNNNQSHKRVWCHFCLDKWVEQAKGREASSGSWGSGNTNVFVSFTAQTEFEQDVCRLFAVCEISWNTASNPELKGFFAKYIPHFALPDRRKLSGPILDNLTTEVIQRTRQDTDGKLGTYTSDGWTNIAKTHVNSSVMNAETTPPLLRNHDMTGQELLEIIISDINLRPDEDHGALRICVGKKREQIAAAEKAINLLVKSDSFWSNLRRFTVMPAMATPSNTLQAPGRRLDVVALTLGNLFHYFSSLPASDSRVRRALLVAIERRFIDTDQELIILATYVNPLIRGSIFNPELLPPAAMFHIIPRTVSRLLRIDATDDVEFFQALLSYDAAAEKFTSARMNVAMYRQVAKLHKRPLALAELWKHQGKLDLLPPGGTAIRGPLIILAYPYPQYSPQLRRTRARIQ